MFAKNKPVKRVDLDDGNWVELQCLSKGQKDAIKSDLADAFKGVEIENKDGTPLPKDGTTLPDGFLAKLHAANYRKLQYSIKAWSANEVPITLDNIKDLDDATFDAILQAVNDMNELSPAEEKNS